MPAIAHRVWKGNKRGEGTNLPLAGIGIGNGLTDPEVQYGEQPRPARPRSRAVCACTSSERAARAHPSLCLLSAAAYYPDMAVSTNQHAPAVSSLTYVAMKLAVPACVAAIRACNRANSTFSTAICTAAQTGCNLAEIEPYQLSGLNVYDMRIPCEVPGLCYDFSNVAKYLARPEVLEYLGIDKDHAAWSDCNMAVNMMFRGDWMKNYQQQLPEMLSDGIRVLIYAGDQDFICNHLGNKAWTLQMDWPGKEAFNGAEDRPWRARTERRPDEHAGDVRSAKGLTFLRVFAAGHMVPMDQPSASLEMLDQFLAGKL